MARGSQFKFRAHDKIGNLSAEDDAQYLYDCFIDTGTLELLRNCSDPRAIVSGRTGAGKTALLLMLLDREERAVELNPHDIAISYVSNSNILKFFRAIDVTLDPFFKALWRHVITVEILKMRFNLDHENYRPNFFQNVRTMLFGNRAHLEAFEYLDKWGSSFFKTTQENIIEITKRTEDDLAAGAGIEIDGIASLGAEAANKLSVEERRVYAQRGQEVINQIQVQQLTVVFNALDEHILDDRVKKYFVCIDRLDEQWIDDAMRYQVLRALIETMKEFNSKVSNAKVTIALRNDLFDRLLTQTTGAGFQDEKYRDLTLSVRWNKKQLTELLDARIDLLIRYSYTRETVTHRDLLPRAVGKRKQPIMDWLLNRTMMRPRDVIAFFNCCMETSEGEPQVRPSLLTDSEIVYSENRLQSLLDEWSEDYPYLRLLFDLLKNREKTFPLAEIESAQLDDLCIRALEDRSIDESSPQLDSFREYFNSASSAADVRNHIARVLYRVGVIGVKTESFAKIRWSFLDRSELKEDQIDDQAQITVHQMLCRSLGVRQ